MQEQKDELGKQLVERNQEVTIMEEKNIQVCCCPISLPVYCTLTLLTILQKLRWQHEAKDEQDKATKEVVDRASKKRSEAFKAKRRTVAREAAKAMKDARESKTAEQVQRETRRGNTKLENTRQDNTKQDKTRQSKKREDKARLDKTKQD